jgi:hypothetical protein
MKPVGIISTTALFLLLGITAPAVAQQEKQDEKAKPAKQEQQAKPEKQQQAKPTQQQHQQQPQQARGQQDQQRQKRQQQDNAAKHQQQANRQQGQQRQQQANRPSRQEQHGQRGQQQAVWQEHRAHNWQSEHRDWQQRGGYNGYRIPEDRYRGNFGPHHWFRIYSYPVEVYGGYPRFQYGGFWFGLLDPWPEYWADDWYDNDDVYIVYSGEGYYMYNRRYPRDRIAITVYVN